MQELYITTEDGTMFIKGADDDNIFYRIRKQELPLVRDSDLSEWVMQLMDKTWIDVGTLYRLAQIIKQEFPKNRIDWKKTFFVVEKANYLETLGEVMTEKQKSIVDGLMEKIEFGRKETTEETHGLVHEIVEKRLVEFGLYS